VFRAGEIQGEDIVVSGVKTKLEPLLLAHFIHTRNHKKWIRIEKLMTPQNKGGQEFKITND